MSAALSQPEAGLHEVLSAWSGVGSLFATLASMQDDLAEREWTAEDVRRRALRLLLLELGPTLQRWPTSTRKWEDALPIISTRYRFRSETPQPRVDWRRTRLTGWPPRDYVIRRRHRASDQLTLSVLAWVLGWLQEAFTAALSFSGGGRTEKAGQLPAEVRVPVSAALPLLERLPAADETLTNREEIQSIRGLGWPWTAVADTAASLYRFERGGVDAYARRLLAPEGFPDRLFQLGVLGQLLLELKRLPGVTVTSLRPIADGSGGPVYAVVDQSGRTWDLWFEAASCWERYAARDSYQILASGLTQIDGRPFAPAHLRPDLLLARPGGEVLSLECKFPHIGLDPGYVAAGFPQAHAYAGQLARSFRRVHSYVIGPQELVPTRSSLRIRGVRVGFAGPQHLDEILDSLFN